MKKLITNIAVASCLSTSLYAAYNDNNTDYSLEPAQFYTKVDAIEPMSTANMVICILKGLRGDAMVNKGKYSVLIDMDKCGDANSKEKMYAIAESTRADNDSPQTVKMWVPKFGVGDGQTAQILGNAVITKGPSKTNPVGEFFMTFKSVVIVGGETKNPFKGEVIASVDANGKSLIKFYQDELSFEDGSHNISKAAISKSTDGKTGAVLTQGKVRSGENKTNKTFALVWDDTLSDNKVLGQEHNGTVSDYTNFTGSSKVCLDKTKFSKKVYGYGLFDKSKGKLLDINSGFPIEAEDSNGNNVYGYIGYWGTWLENDKQISDLSNIKKVDYATDTKTEITLSNAIGVLYETSDNGWKRINNISSNLSLTNTDGNVSYTFDSTTMQLSGDHSVSLDLSLASDSTKTYYYYKDENLTIASANNTIIKLEEPKRINYTLNLDDVYESSVTVNGVAMNNGDTTYIDYGGKGNLWIQNKDENSFDFNPAFTFKDGVILTVDSKEYVVKALFGEREIQQSAGGLTDCSNLDLSKTNSLSLPTGVTNPYNDESTMPTEANFPSKISFINGVRVDK